MGHIYINILMTAKTQIIDLLNQNPNITHVLLISIINSNSVNNANRDCTTFIKNFNTPILFNNNNITINWNAHGKNSTRFYTTYSIYSDTITLFHGRAICGLASHSINFQVHGTVLKRLDLDNLSTRELN